jgi:hypothetical protein
MNLFSGMVISIKCGKKARENPPAKSRSYLWKFEEIAFTTRGNFGVNPWVIIP